jgi:HSP90 family molecular chaperone
LSADYEKIRDENIARYGWDTAVLDLLGQLYSERTHFIFELIQNAEDAGATELTFELFEDRLEVKHDGRPFTEPDVRGICGVGKSGKSGDLTKIGKFGIGFKSVYAYSKSPRVYISASRATSGRFLQIRWMSRCPGLSSSSLSTMTPSPRRWPLRRSPPP